MAKLRSLGDVSGGGGCESRRTRRVKAASGGFGGEGGLVTQAESGNCSQI